MHGLALLALTLVTSIGPNGVVVERMLHPAAAVVPVEALAETAANLWVVYHEQPDLAMAFYQPASPPAGSETSADFSLLLLAANGGFERLLPNLDVPRLFLYAPYYRPDGHTRPIAAMPLDVTEYLFNALLEALLDQRGDALPVAIEERMRRAMPSAPEEHRQEAYLAALTDFGSQCLSVALELRRSVVRLRANGKDPCPAVRHPATLFGAWGKLFRDQEFRGRYSAEGRQVHAQEALTPGDKRLLMRAVLGSEWTGDVQTDFDFGCPP